MRAKTLLKTAASVAAVAALTSGCLQSGGDDEEPAAEGGGGEVAGSEVTIWTSVDQPVVDGLQEAIDPKAEELGMTITLEKVENINQLIVTRVQAGDAPDIAMIPQPGVVADLASRDALTPLDFLDVDALTEDMTAGTIEAGTVDGTFYGLLASMNVKSLVFYPKKAWDAAGYEAPTTLEELSELTEQIKADGTTPWCMGIGSDTATGWPATDWFEDLIMRFGGVEGYNSWVSHETPFDSDLVREAAAYFEETLFTEGNVVGGRSAISSTAFGVAGNPLFDDPAGCMLLKQGSFITTFFPEDVQADLEAEVGVFAFPGVEEGDLPVLGGGDLAVLTKDSAGARAAMEILTDPTIGEIAASNGSNYISPFKTFDTSLYPNPIQADAAEVAYGSSAFLFDGSDQMPGAVGAGTFWRDITAWISGQEDLDTALTNIDDSWPAS